jgi:tetratricopeptide (TPR) repeat protein
LRYGYAGFRKRSLSSDFTEHCRWTKEAVHGLKQADALYKSGLIEQSAEVLNSIPALPRNELLLQIPNELLNRSRMVEKTLSSLGMVPVHPFMEELHKLIMRCEGKHLRYSSARLGVLESIALSWDAKPVQQLKRSERLLKALEKRKGGDSYLLFNLRFTLLISIGIASVLLSKIDKASGVARRCNRLLKKRRHVSVKAMIDLGNLFGFLEDKAQAEYWYRRCLDMADEKEKAQVMNYLADVIFFKGEYRKALAIVTKVTVPEWALFARINLFRSMKYLSSGKPQKAIALSIETLSKLKKETLHGGITAAYSIIASSYASLGDKQKAVSTLRRLRPFLRKYNLQRLLERLEILTVDPGEVVPCLSEYRNLLPVERLIVFLRRGEYRKAYRFARKKGIVSEFHRYVLFFPGATIRLIERGRTTGLPPAMVRLPVFNREQLHYHIKFLGDLIINKNGGYLRAKIPPKPSSFLIAIALRAGDPGKGIPLDGLLANFWGRSRNASRNLTHLLAELRKWIKLPSHLLEISQSDGSLVNRGVHITTDYGEFREGIAQAKAFQRAGEWDFARREFLRSFALFRGEPFRKMYDDWSDERRLEMLFLFEREIQDFIDALASKGRKADAARMERKAERIAGKW